MDIDISTLAESEWPRFIDHVQAKPIIRKRFTRQRNKAWFNASLYVRHTVNLHNDAPLPGATFRIPAQFGLGQEALVRHSWSVLVDNIRQVADNNARNIRQTMTTTHLTLAKNTLNIHLRGHPGTGNSLFLYYLVALVLSPLDHRVPGLMFGGIDNKTFMLSPDALRCGYFKDKVDDMKVLWRRSDKSSKPAGSYDTSTMDWRMFWGVQDRNATFPYTYIQIRVWPFPNTQPAPTSNRNFYYFHERWSCAELALAARVCHNEFRDTDTYIKRLRSVGPVPKALFAHTFRGVRSPCATFDPTKPRTDWIETVPWLTWVWIPMKDQSGRQMEPLHVAFTSFEYRDQVWERLSAFVERFRNVICKSSLVTKLVAYMDTQRDLLPEPEVLSDSGESSTSSVAVQEVKPTYLEPSVFHNATMTQSRLRQACSSQVVPPGLDQSKTEDLVQHTSQRITQLMSAGTTPDNCMNQLKSSVMSSNTRQDMCQNMGQLPTQYTCQDTSQKVDQLSTQNLGQDMCQPPSQNLLGHVSQDLDPSTYRNVTQLSHQGFETDARAPSEWSETESTKELFHGIDEGLYVDIPSSGPEPQPLRCLTDVQRPTYMSQQQDFYFEQSPAYSSPFSQFPQLPLLSGQNVYTNSYGTLSTGFVSDPCMLMDRRASWTSPNFHKLSQPTGHTGSVISDTGSQRKHSTVTVPEEKAPEQVDDDHRTSLSSEASPAHNNPSAETDYTMLNTPPVADSGTHLKTHSEVSQTPQPIPSTQGDTSSAAELIPSNPVNTSSPTEPIPYTQVHTHPATKPIPPTQLNTCLATEPIPPTQLNTCLATEPIPPTQLNTCLATEPIASTQLDTSSATEPIPSTQLSTPPTIESTAQVDKTPPIRSTSGNQRIASEPLEALPSVARHASSVPHIELFQSSPVSPVTRDSWVAASSPLAAELTDGSHTSRSASRSVASSATSPISPPTIHLANLYKGVIHNSAGTPQSNTSTVASRAAPCDDDAVIIDSPLAPEVTTVVSSKSNPTPSLRHRSTPPAKRRHQGYPSITTMLSSNFDFARPEVVDLDVDDEEPPLDVAQLIGKEEDMDPTPFQKISKADRQAKAADDYAPVDLGCLLTAEEVAGLRSIMSSRQDDVNLSEIRAIAREQMEKYHAARLEMRSAKSSLVQLLKEYVDYRQAVTSMTKKRRLTKREWS